jgi:membrane-associated phospholipid phosphatase
MNDATESLGDKAAATIIDPEGHPSGTVITVSPWRATVRARWAQIVMIAGLSIYTVLAVLAHYYAYFDWDLSIARNIQSISLPGFRTFMIWVSQLGSGWVPTALVGGASLLMFALRFRLEATTCLLGVTLGAALNTLLKDVSARPRPSDMLVNVINQYRHESFPSGHVVFFVEYFGFLFFLSYVLFRRGRLRLASLILLGLLIVLVGLSRVYMGAHWPSDVMGAYLAGGLWLLLMIEVYRRLKARQTRLNS